MKRVLTLILTACLCFALALSAYADVIWEPEDAFYQKHRDECRYENRTYIASGEAGYAGVHKDPKTKKVKEELPNGTEFWVSYVWEGDGGWALGLNTRWVPLSELTVKYDGISFEEEHGAEFRYPENGEVLSLQDYGCMQLWTFPGDKEPFACFRWTGEEARFSQPIEDLSFYTVYEDPQGNRWGKLGYLYGYRNFWVCLTDPEAAGSGGAGETQSEPEPAPAPAPNETAAPAPTAAPVTAAPTEPPPEKRESGFPWLPAGLAGGAVVVAGALLALFRKKK